MKKRYFMEGLKSGLPICLGYFSVSIAFGMMAIHLKRPIGEAVLISLTNLTSAGQFAGLKIIGNRGGLIEVFLSTLIINARYFLMSLSISQKLAPKTKWYEKLLIAYGITDEIFAISMSQTRALTFSYMMGVIVISVFGWVSGTFVGGDRFLIASSLGHGCFWDRLVWNVYRDRHSGNKEKSKQSDRGDDRSCSQHVFLFFFVAERRVEHYCDHGGCKRFDGVAMSDRSKRGGVCGWLGRKCW